MATQKILLSPCHQAIINGSKRNGVFVGTCKTCGCDVTRYNFDKWKQEWLDGRSWETSERLREVQESDWTVLREERHSEGSTRRIMSNLSHRDQYEMKYRAVAQREVAARNLDGKPVTTAYLHMIELKYSSMAAHDMACDALRKLDALGENGCVCWQCGAVYHKDEGSLLDDTFCSDECYHAR